METKSTSRPLADMSFGLNHQAVRVARQLAKTKIAVPGYIQMRTSPWYNGREKGVVISVGHFTGDGGVLHIAFFEHRNSDEIHACKWIDKWDVNPPNTDDGDSLKLAYPSNSKNDTAFFVEHGEINEMAEWIKEQVEIHLAKLAELEK